MVEGTYEMSLKEIGWLYLCSILMIAPLGLAAGHAWSKFEQSDKQSDAVAAAFLVAFIAVIVLWVLPRVSARYEFRGGFVSKVSRGGVVRWREDLSKVPRVVLCRDNFNTFITLRWPDRRRSLVIPDTLAIAIDKAQEAIDNVAVGAHGT